MQFQEGNIVCGDTLNKSNDELYRLLLLLDYSKEYFFFSYSEHVADAVRKAVKEKEVKIGLDDSILFYFLPKEEALQFDIQYVLISFVFFLRFFVHVESNRIYLGIQMKLN